MTNGLLVMAASMMCAACASPAAPQRDGLSGQDLCRTLADFRQLAGERVTVSGYWLPGQGDGIWIISDACLTAMYLGPGSLSAEGYDAVERAALTVSEEAGDVVSGVFEGRLAASLRGERLLIIERASDIQVVPAPPALVAQFGDLMYSRGRGRY